MLERDCRSAFAAWGVEKGRLLLAVSGGLDSCVLLAVVLRIARGLELELAVAHVNHQLRGAESDADEDFVRGLAEEAGVPIFVRRVDPQALRRGGSSRDRPTLEEAARTLRRQALRDVAGEFDARWIATAHHAGDQAETVLMRVLRGTGPVGLGAMAPIREEKGIRWIRPLLAVDPARLGEYARGETRDARGRSLEWREDRSNLDLGFSRNQLRHEWIPKLAENFNPQLLRALCNLAEAQRSDAAWIDDLVEQAARGRIEIGDTQIELAIDGWASLPEALARRLVRRALVSAGLARALTQRHVTRVIAFLCRGRQAGRDQRLELPQGVLLVRADDRFVLGPISLPNEIGPSDNARVPGRD